MVESRQKAHSRGTHIPLENPPTLFETIATLFLCAAILQFCEPRGPKIHRSSAPAEAQRAPASCSPPPGVATDCATLWVAQHSDQSSAQFSAPFGLSPIPPERQSRWATGPATHWVARARPKFPPKAPSRVYLTAAPLSLRRCLRALQNSNLYPVFPRAGGNLIQKRGTRGISTVARWGISARFCSPQNE